MSLLLLLGEGEVGPPPPPPPPPPPAPPPEPVPLPSMGLLGSRLYNAILPMVPNDAQYGYAAQALCIAIERMLVDVYEIVRDQEDGTPGWATVMNPMTAPEDALPWLGQFVGVINRPETGDVLRGLIAARVGQQRGTVAAMRAAAEPYLTGTKSLTFIERDGHPYRLTVLSITEETPDPDAVLRALMSQKPAGILLSFNDRAGLTYELVKDNFATYQDLKDAYATYEDVRENEPI